MPSKFIKSLQTLIFLILSAGLFSLICNICQPRWYMPWMSTPNVDAVNFLPEDSIDVAVFGSSAGIRSFSPLELWKEYGISAYNFSTEQQPIMGSYYILKDLLKRQSPKVVLVEAWELIGNSSENFYRKAFDYLNLSSDKLEAAMIHSKSETSDTLFSYLAPVLKYHTNWKNLTKYQLSHFDSSDFPKYYRGFVMESNTNPVDFDGWTDTGKDTALYNAEALHYLSLFVDLCEENDIAVILYKCPINSNIPAHNAIQKFADSKKIPFIDFHMKNIIEESGFDYSKGIDGGQHDNTVGAVQITHYLGKYLSEHYKFIDRRENPQFAYLNKMLDRYEHEKNNELFIHEKDITNYLNLLNSLPDSNYTALLSVTDEGSGQINNSLQEKFIALGFQTNFSNFQNQRFVGVWQNGKAVYEIISEAEELEYTGTFPDGTKYYIKNEKDSQNASSMIIDGVAYNKNKFGIYITIYDNMTARIIDTVCWNLGNDGIMIPVR